MMCHFKIGKTSAGQASQVMCRQFGFKAPSKGTDKNGIERLCRRISQQWQLTPAPKWADAVVWCSCGFSQKAIFAFVTTMMAGVSVAKILLSC
jgi:hypothetical protein